MCDLSLVSQLNINSYKAKPVWDTDIQFITIRTKENQFSYLKHIWVINLLSKKHQNK